ncbi:hypothetical protein BGZ59_009029, partial [Podila verticillata]
GHGFLGSRTAPRLRRPHSQPDFWRCQWCSTLASRVHLPEPPRLWQGLSSDSRGRAVPRTCTGQPAGPLFQDRAGVEARKTRM